MHPTKAVPTRRFWSLLFSLVCGLVAAGPARAQEAVPGPAAVPMAPGAIIVPVNGTKMVEMSTKLLIREVRVENPKIVRVQTLLENPRAVLLTGISPGTTRVWLTDEKKNTETFEVVVPSGEEVAAREAARRLLDLIRRTVPTAAVDVVVSGGNTFILTGTVQQAESVRILIETAKSVLPGAQVINALRIGGVQIVELDVVVAAVNRSEARSMGFNFQINRENYFVSNVLGGGTIAAAIAPALTGGNASLAGVPNTSFGFVADKTGFVGFLEALRTERLAKFHACPRLATLSGKPAYLLSGGEVPVLTASGLGAPDVEYKKFGTVVEFLPMVLGDKIYLEVRPTVSQPNAGLGINIGGATPTTVTGFDTRSVQSSIILEDGQTLAIGGLIQTRVNGGTTKVPVLGDLPFLGAAFRTVSYEESEEELLILVTPRLVDPMACNQLPKFLPGQETRSPDDFELFLEGILEAPRGGREVYPGGRYQPAYLNSPTAGQYPCAGGNCNHGHAGRCQGGNCYGGTRGDSNGWHAPTATGTGAPAAQPGTSLLPETRPQTSPAGPTSAVPVTDSIVPVENVEPTSPVIREVPVSETPVNFGPVSEGPSQGGDLPVQVQVGQPRPDEPR
jgi:pilus assembly protein CpaC